MAGKSIEHLMCAMKSGQKMGQKGGPGPCQKVLKSAKNGETRFLTGFWTVLDTLLDDYGYGYTVNRGRIKK